MNSKSVGSQVVEVDFDSPIFDNAVQDEDFDTPVRININPAAAKPKVEGGSPPDANLLDLDDDETLNKLGGGSFRRIKPEGDGWVRFALAQPAVLLKTHLHPVKHSPILCLGKDAPCCQLLNEARDVVGVLAISYPAADPRSGGLRKGEPAQIHAAYVSLSPSAARRMKDLLPEGTTSIFTPDWKMKKKANGAIGYEFAVQAPVAAYSQLGLEKQAQELLAPYRDGKKLRERLARTMTALEIKTLAKGDTDPKLDDPEEL